MKETAKPDIKEYTFANMILDQSCGATPLFGNLLVQADIPPHFKLQKKKPFFLFLSQDYPTYKRKLVIKYAKIILDEPAGISAMKDFFKVWNLSDQEEAINWQIILTK